MTFTEVLYIPTVIGCELSEYDAVAAEAGEHRERKQQDDQNAGGKHNNL
jgi:hypothetical protein